MQKVTAAIVIDVIFWWLIFTNSYRFKRIEYFQQYKVQGQTHRHNAHHRRLKRKEPKRLTLIPPGEN